MGIWTTYIYNYNPLATINLAQITDATLEYINAKLDDVIEGKPDNFQWKHEHGITPVSELFGTFNDTMKIWGYFDEERCKCLRDMAAAMSEITTIVFHSDADNVNYFAIRFDPTTKNFTTLMIDDTDILESDYDTIMAILKRDGVIWSTLEDSEYKKRADAFYFEMLRKEPRLLYNRDALTILMALNGFS